MGEAVGPFTPCSEQGQGLDREVMVPTIELAPSTFFDFFFVNRLMLRCGSVFWPMSGALHRSLVLFPSKIYIEVKL